LTHSLKAPGFNPCTYQVKNRFQAFAFKLQLVPLHPGITNDVLIQTAMELDPAAAREAEQATKMQSGLKTMMDKMAMGQNGKLTDAQLAQLKALHEQLGSHLFGDEALPLKQAGAGKK
jgi:hypothetical protein